MTETRRLILRVFARTRRDPNWCQSVLSKLSSIPTGMPIRWEKGIDKEILPMPGGPERSAALKKAPSSLVAQGAGKCNFDSSSFDFHFDIDSICIDRRRYLLGLVTFLPRFSYQCCNQNDSFLAILRSPCIPIQKNKHFPLWYRNQSLISKWNVYRSLVSNWSVCICPPKAVEARYCLGPFPISSNGFWYQFSWVREIFSLSESWWRWWPLLLCSTIWLFDWHLLAWLEPSCH